MFVCFFFQAEDGIRDSSVTGVQTCALPILITRSRHRRKVYDEGIRGWRRLGNIDGLRQARPGVLTDNLKRTSEILRDRRSRHLLAILRDDNLNAGSNILGNDRLCRRDRGLNAPDPPIQRSNFRMRSMRGWYSRTDEGHQA